MRFLLAPLGKLQRQVLEAVGPVMTDLDFYLAGGTALAVQLGHRRSIDLDWFTPKPLDEPLRLAERLRGHGISFRTGKTAPGTLYGTVSRIRVSLIEYRYPLLENLLPWKRFGCRLAALPDLTAMKLAALAQRGAKKDFVDLYALSRRRIALAQMVTWYRRKYRVRDVGHLLYSLTYFDDANRERTPPLLWPTDWTRIRIELRAWVQHALREAGIVNG
jgi:hypothetical protein